MENSFQDQSLALISIKLQLYLKIWEKNWKKELVCLNVGFFLIINWNNNQYFVFEYSKDPHVKKILDRLVQEDSFFMNYLINVIEFKINKALI